MEDRETARMRKHEESKTTRIMMATVPLVTSGLGLRKFQADGFLLTRVYKLKRCYLNVVCVCVRACVLACVLYIFNVYKDKSVIDRGLMFVRAKAYKHKKTLILR